MEEQVFKYTYEVLDDYGNKIVDEMEAILIKNGKRATGKLINSLDYEIYERKGKNGPEQFVLIVEFEQYGIYVNRKNYWRNKMPPVEVIKRWLREKKIPFDSSKVRYIGGKNLKSTKNEDRLNSLAWAIAKSIKKRGTLNPAFNNPTNFLKPYDDIKMKKGTKYYTDVENAFKKDVSNYLSSMSKKISDK